MAPKLSFATIYQGNGPSIWKFYRLYLWCPNVPDFYKETKAISLSFGAYSLYLESGVGGRRKIKKSGCNPVLSTLLGFPEFQARVFQPVQLWP